MAAAHFWRLINLMAGTPVDPTATKGSRNLFSVGIYISRGRELPSLSGLITRGNAKSPEIFTKETDYLPLANCAAAIVSHPQSSATPKLRFTEAPQPTLSAQNSANGSF